MMDLHIQGETSVQARRRLEAGYKELRNQRIMELFTMIVYGTPVDTGQARGGWRVATSEVEWPQNTLDPDGSATIAAAWAALQNIHHWANVYISNGEPHIGALEHGHSGQAPVGIVRVQLPAFRAMHGDVL